MQPPAAAAAAAAPRSAGGSARGYAPRHGHAETDAQVHSYIDSHHPNEEVRHRPLRKQQFTAAQLEDAKRPKGPPAAALHGLADTWGVGNHAAFVRAVHRLPAERQFALMDNTAGVAAHLQVCAGTAGTGTCCSCPSHVFDAAPPGATRPRAHSPALRCRRPLQALGIGAEQVASVLQHCPALFSFPAEVRGWRAVRRCTACCVPCGGGWTCSLSHLHSAAGRASPARPLPARLHSSSLALPQHPSCTPTPCRSGRRC